MSQHKEQQGFVTFAQNTDTVDYLNLAYVQCLNIKATQQENKYAVIVDAATMEKVNEAHRNTFDYIIPLTVDYNDPARGGKFANEWQVFYQTPFKETIKLESDLLFTRSIDHWWTAFRLKNICLSTGTKNYLGINSTIRKYRELFDAKKTVYNDSHDIKIHGYEVELYVQDTNEPVISLGEYSVLHNSWIKLPRKRRAHVDQIATKLKYKKLSSDIVSLL